MGVHGIVSATASWPGDGRDLSADALGVVGFTRLTLGPDGTWNLVLEGDADWFEDLVSSLEGLLGNRLDRVAGLGLDLTYESYDDPWTCELAVTNGRLKVSVLRSEFEQLATPEAVRYETGLTGYALELPDPPQRALDAGILATTDDLVALCLGTDAIREHLRESGLTEETLGAEALEAREDELLGRIVEDALEGDALHGRIERAISEDEYLSEVLRDLVDGVVGAYVHEELARLAPHRERHRGL